MLLGLELDAMLCAVGHDGSEVMWPEMEEPIKRKAFHIEELEYAAFKLGWLLCHFSPGVSYSPSGDPSVATTIHFPLKEVMQSHDGLMLGRYRLTGRSHAVAWSAKEGLIYDPAGRLVQWKDDLFNVEAFYTAIRRGA